MKKLKIFGFFFCVLVWFKLISYLGFFIYPSEVHQKYLPGQHNGLGAIGDVYQGQPFKIAVFGSSTIQGISKELKNTLDNKKVHIDDFSVENHYFESIISQMKTLKRLGKHYDIVWISFPMWTHHDKQEQMLYHFSHRWFTKESLWTFPHIIINFFNRKKEHKNEELFKLYKKYFTTFILPSNTKLPKQPETIETTKMSSSLLEHLTTFKLPSHKKAEAIFIKHHRHNIEKLMHASEKIGDKIYFSPIRFSWNYKFSPDFYIPPVDIIYNFFVDTYASDFFNIYEQYSDEKNNIITAFLATKFMKQPRKIWYDQEKHNLRRPIQKILQIVNAIEKDIMKAKKSKTLDYSTYIENLFSDPKKSHINNLKQIYNNPHYFHYFEEKGHLLTIPLMALEQIWYDPGNHNLKVALYKKMNQTLQKINITEINIMKTKGSRILDYLTYIENLSNNPKKPYINNPEQLYNDAFHFSEKGRTLIAQFISKELRPLVDQKIRNQNKQNQEVLPVPIRQ